MMSRDCQPPDRMDEFLAMDPEDPRRRHLDECPRCRGLLMAYRRFLAPEPIPGEADLADARARLGSVLHQEIFGGKRVPEPSRPSASFKNLLRSVWRPGWRPAVALGGLAAVALTVIRLAGPPSWSPSEQTIRLRDAEDASSSVPVLLTPLTGSDGSLSLRWRRSAGAEEYQVVLHGLNLEELHRLPARADTSVHLDPALLTRVGQNEGSLVWQVIARSGGDEIARSNPAIVRIP